MPTNDILINTGNILFLNKLKSRTGLNATEELIESLKIIRENSECKDDASSGINEKNSDLCLSDVDRKDLKITIKIFISSIDTEILKEAFDTVLKILHTDIIEAVVLAYETSESADDKFKGLQHLWTVFEEYFSSGKLCSIGVSDVDTDMFINLFNWAKVKPNIIQINLDACCIVPPALQDFTKQNDVQLLTHSDPRQILPKDAVSQLFAIDTCLQWVVRYQIHLKCRGVLSTKGYVVRINTLSS